MAQGKNRELTIILTAVIVIAFAAIDIATPQILRSSVRDDFRWLFFAAVGVCIAQVTLIASWAVLAPGNIVMRLPWALLFGLGMWYSLLLGIWYCDQWRRLNPHDTLVLGEILLAGVTVLQIPLWIGKRALRFRMVRAGEDPTPIADERFQFNLQHLLIGTFIFAVALSPIRYVLPKEPVRDLWPDAELLLLIPVAIVAVSCGDTSVPLDRVSPSGVGVDRGMGRIRIDYRRHRTCDCSHVRWRPFGSKGLCNAGCLELIAGRRRLRCGASLLRFGLPLAAGAASSAAAAGMDELMPQAQAYRPASPPLSSGSCAGFMQASKTVQKGYLPRSSSIYSFCFASSRSFSIRSLTVFWAARKEVDDASCRSTTRTMWKPSAASSIGLRFPTGR